MKRVALFLIVSCGTINAHTVEAKCYLGISFNEFKNENKRVDLESCRAAAWKGGKHSHSFNDIRGALGDKGTEKDARYMDDQIKSKKKTFFTFKYCNLKIRDMNEDLIKGGKVPEFKEIITFNNERLLKLTSKYNYVKRYNPGISSGDLLNGRVDFYYQSYFNTYPVDIKRNRGLVFFSHYNTKKFSFVERRDSKLLRKYKHDLNKDTYIPFEYNGVEYVLSHEEDQLLFSLKGRLIQSKLRSPCLKSVW